SPRVPPVGAKRCWCSRRYGRLWSFELNSGNGHVSERDWAWDGEAEGDRARSNLDHAQYGVPPPLTKAMYAQRRAQLSAGIACPGASQAGPIIRGSQTKKSCYRAPHRRPFRAAFRSDGLADMVQMVVPVRLDQTMIGLGTRVSRVKSRPHRSCWRGV